MLRAGATLLSCSTNTTFVGDSLEVWLHPKRGEREKKMLQNQLQRSFMLYTEALVSLLLSSQIDLSSSAYLEIFQAF